MVFPKSFYYQRYVNQSDSDDSNRCDTTNVVEGNNCEGTKDDDNKAKRLHNSTDSQSSMQSGMPYQISESSEKSSNNCGSLECSEEKNSNSCLRRFVVDDTDDDDDVAVEVSDEDCEDVPTNDVVDCNLELGISQEEIDISASLLIPGIPEVETWPTITTPEAPMPQSLLDDSTAFIDSTSHLDEVKSGSSSFLSSPNSRPRVSTLDNNINNLDDQIDLSNQTSESLEQSVSSESSSLKLAREREPKDQTYENSHDTNEQDNHQDELCKIADSAGINDEEGSAHASLSPSSLFEMADKQRTSRPKISIRLKLNNNGENSSPRKGEDHTISDTLLSSVNSWEIIREIDADHQTLENSTLQPKSSSCKKLKIKLARTKSAERSVKTFLAKNRSTARIMPVKERSANLMKKKAKTKKTNNNGSEETDRVNFSSTGLAAEVRLTNSSEAPSGLSDTDPLDQSSTARCNSKPAATDQGQEALSMDYHKKSLVDINEMVSSDFNQIVGYAKQLNGFPCLLCDYFSEKPDGLESHVIVNHREIFAPDQFRQHCQDAGFLGHDGPADDDVTAICGDNDGDNVDRRLDKSLAKIVEVELPKIRCRMFGCKFYASDPLLLLHHVKHPDVRCRKLRQRNFPKLMKKLNLKRRVKIVFLHCRKCHFKCRTPPPLLRHYQKFHTNESISKEFQPRIKKNQVLQQAESVSLEAASSHGLKVSERKRKSQSTGCPKRSRTEVEREKEPVGLKWHHQRTPRDKANKWSKTLREPINANGNSSLELVESRSSAQTKFLLCPILNGHVCKKCRFKTTVVDEFRKHWSLNHDDEIYTSLSTASVPIQTEAEIEALDRVCINSKAASEQLGQVDLISPLSVESDSGASSTTLVEYIYNTQGRDEERPPLFHLDVNFLNCSSCQFQTNLTSLMDQHQSDNHSLPPCTSGSGDPIGNDSWPRESPLNS